jgi:hypothetical protein
VTCAALFATTLASPRTSHAVPQAQPGATAPTGNAAEHFQRGVELYKEGDYRGALVEFQRAYDISPKFQVLFNVAESHYQLQDYANAMKAFQKYLDEGGTQIPAKRRKDVESEIVTLSKRVATVTIVTNEPGATVTIDDVTVGTTPIEALLVSSGRRKITVTLAGRAPASSTVDLAGGDKKTVALEIPPAVTAGPTTTTTTTTETEEPDVVPVVVMWSVTGALALGAVVTGVLALGASSDLEDELARYPGNADELASAKDSTFALGLTTDILIGTSIAAGAVATYFTVDYYLSGEEAAPEEEVVEEGDAEAARARRTKQAAGTTRVTVSPGGLVVGGTF